MMLQNESEILANKTLLIEGTVCFLWFIIIIILGVQWNSLLINGGLGKSRGKPTDARRTRPTQ